MSDTESIILHSFKPIRGRARTGGFEWGREGELSEEQVRVQYDLDVDTTHHDFMPTHDHRLLRLEVPAGLTEEQIEESIEKGLLDQIEGGDFDGSSYDIGRLIPTKKEN